MRFRLFALALAAGMIAGWIRAEESYQTQVSVYPAGQQEYTVEFRIIETHEDGTQDLLSAPKVTCVAGEEAIIKVCDAEEENGIFGTALVNETDSGVEALTTITVKEDGKTLLNTTQKMVMNK